jgi:ParB-like chromosome segregation protein Spo0J
MLEFHPLANLFPLMEGQEFNEFAADIRAHGLREPITLYEGKVLDGRNRYRAATETDIECRFETYTGTESPGVR